MARVYLNIPTAQKGMWINRQDLPKAIIKTDDWFTTILRVIDKYKCLDHLLTILPIVDI